MARGTASEFGEASPRVLRGWRDRHIIGCYYTSGLHESEVTGRPSVDSIGRRVRRTVDGSDTFSSSGRATFNFEPRVYFPKPPMACGCCRQFLVIARGFCRADGLCRTRT